jgi:hypothetical protein
MTINTIITKNYLSNFLKLTVKFLFIYALFASAANAATISVTNTNDSGAGSLRAAITSANAGASGDVIEFNIAGGVVKTISLNSPLPVIVHDLIIDGTSQPGWSNAPLIELNGLSAGGGSIGLEMTSGTLTVRGLVINRFTGYGIKAHCAGNCGGNTISLNVYGSYIGTNASGTASLPNGVGIYLQAEGGQLTSNIGGKLANQHNIISGNISNGLELGENPDYGLQVIRVLNNYIGTNVGGAAALPNLGNGIYVSNFSNIEGESVIYIGDNTSDARNVISGNSKSGIKVDGYAVITGNHIGTNALGTTDLGNAKHGIESSGYTLIGGAIQGAGNVISGNNKSGIYIEDETASYIFGNYIGIDAGGSVAIGNTESGIYAGSYTFYIGHQNAGAGNLISGNGGDGIVYSPTNYGEGVTAFVSANIEGNKIGVNAGLSASVANGGNGISVRGKELEIGSDEPGAANFIGGNAGHGIRLFKNAAATKILSNYIGTNSGSTDLGNGGDGIHVNSADTFTDIGYSGSIFSISPYGNVIAYNNGDGIEVAPEAPGDPAPTLVGIRANSIYSNGEMGIDLGANGVTLNDSLDADTGSNGLQNFPTLSKASAGQIAGNLSSAPNKEYYIDFYRIDGVDASGYGEGRAYLGSIPVTTNGSGDASFNRSGFSLSVGQYITATATGVEGTSEFSQHLVVTQPPGNVALSAAAYSVNESAGTATITINRTGGTSGVVGVNYATSDVSATAGQDYTAVSSTVLLFDGQTSGTFTIPITSDNSYEPNETVQITLSNSSGGAVITNPSTATLTITNDDSPPTISVSDVSKDEGNQGTTAFTFDVTLSAPSAFPVSVDWGTTDAGSTALSSIDYTPVTPTKLNFAPGETGKQVIVSVIGDLTTESNEVFGVNVFNQTNSTIADGQGAGTILNDDNGGKLSFSSAAYSANENGGFATLTVIRANGAAGAVSVDYATTDSGTATASTDFTPVAGTLVFLDGETTRTFTVAIQEDQIAENTETINLILSNPPGGAAIGLAETVLNIMDNDSTSRVLRAVGGNAEPTQNVSVNVELVAQGDEHSIEISLNFDQEILTNPQVAPGADALAGFLTVDYSQAGTGKLGVRLALPANQNFAAGKKQVVAITFNTLQTAAYKSPVTFDDAPIVKKVLGSNAEPLPTNYLDGAVTFAQGLEADIASTTGGDGLYQSNDVVKIRSFLTNCASIDTTTNQFQRADSAPFASKGDGIIASNDVVQARRYANGASSPQTAGGPTAGCSNKQSNTAVNKADSSAMQTDSVNKSARRLRVENTTASAGATAAVNVLVDAVGDESEYAFVLKYDASVLSNPVVSGGNAGSLLRHCNAATAGQINCSIGGFPANNAASGNSGIGEIAAGDNQTLITVTFMTAANAPSADTLLALSNVNTSNDAALLVPINSVNGQVTVFGSAASGVGVSGRVATKKGRAIGNVVVTMTDGNGGVRTATTNASGYYQFTEIPAGETYVLSVRTKRYRFTPNSLVLAVVEDMTDVFFTADN